MPVKLTYQSFENGEPDRVSMVEQDEGGFVVDEFAGRIILVKCLGNQGADIYVASGYYEGEVMPFEDSDKLATQANFHERLLPWTRITFEVQPPNKSKCYLTMRSLPMVRIVKNPLFMAAAEEE